MYTAELRMPSMSSPEERSKRVDTVLEQVGG
jgi:hypothetical protein